MNERPASVGPVSPLFIVADVVRAAAHYEQRLGFQTRLLLPEAEPFFAIVGRGTAQLMLKAVGDGVAALPNPLRHAGAPWDAFVHAADPDGLAGELEGRGTRLLTPVLDRDDGLRGFEVADADGHVLFFGRPGESP